MYLNLSIYQAEVGMTVVHFSRGDKTDMIENQK